MNMQSNIARAVEDPDVEADQLGITRFDFQNKVFSINSARFGLHPPMMEPRFYVMLGDMEASTDIKALKNEFAIAHDSPDGKLLNVVLQSLKYVPDIRPGDSIPTELLDGSASWSVSSKHKDIARNRLQVQLLSWVSGKEILITDPLELESFLGQIENKAMVKEAFAKAAEAMGRPDDTDAVLEQFELLARELCYIEALRDRFVAIKDVLKKLDVLKNDYGRDANGDIQRITALLNRAVMFYEKQFADVDAQTGEIVGALKSISRQVKFIRKVRDDLHFATRDWNSLLQRWHDITLKKSRTTDILLGDTYRLLASRFATAKSIRGR
jgi:hypothetical protein